MKALLVSVLIFAAGLAVALEEPEAHERLECSQEQEVILPDQNELSIENRDMCRIDQISRIK